jgi:hypothetical protein
VTLRWRIDGGTLVTKTMTITDAPNGVCTYTFDAADLVAGIMQAEVRVTLAGKFTTSVEPFFFTVRPTT